MQIQELTIDVVHPNPANIRDDIPDDDPGLQRLTDEISTMGVKSPIVVYPHPEKQGQFVVQDGHNRRRAALAAGMSTIPALVIDAPSRGQREDLETMLTTGRNHRPLNRLEESRGIQRMLDLGMNESTIGKKFKQPKSHVLAKAKIETGAEDLRKAYGYGHLDLEQVMELQKLEEAGHTDIFERALALRETHTYRSFSHIMQTAKLEVEKERAAEEIAATGAAQAPADASYSGKYQEVSEELSEADHAAAGHEYRIRHYGDEPEVQWFAPVTKPATGLTEEQKAEKRRVRDLNQKLAVSYRVRREHLVKRVQDPNAGDSKSDQDMLFELLWPDVSRLEEHLLAEVTQIPFPAEKVNDAAWDDRRAWLEKVERRLRSFSWRQLTRLKALAEYYVAADKKLRRTEGFDLDVWDWHQRATWLTWLRQHFGYQFDDTEKTLITEWQDANWEEVLKTPAKRIET